ncbi:endolytic transglycosylase MltG [Sporosarcina limicola]|uniref:Aminodeoxychorismate lyase n=1 Tax=Sporosarcina limicola TaxID=34101 RepID=A0A927MIF3_9BACL|nr:endolytic transglycosylase MltG [Sporosarcina limicola]MBE1553747.1 hypothetical protein [Sporosarcina limicola]
MIRELLRAAGIGCILAGSILYFTNSGKSVSDAEIRQMQDEVKNLRGKLSRTNEELAIAQTATSVKVSIPEIEKNTHNDESKNDKTVNNSSKVIKTTVKIKPGSNSTVVSATLEKLGIVKNADKFNAFLTDNNLSGKIQIGEYELDSSMDFQKIAKMITTIK